MWLNPWSCHSRRSLLQQRRVQVVTHCTPLSMFTALKAGYAGIRWKSSQAHGTWKVCSQFCFTDASVNTNISFLELSLLSGSVRSTLAVHHGDTGRRELNMFSLQFGGWNLHDNVENRVQTILVTVSLINSFCTTVLHTVCDGIKLLFCDDVGHFILWCYFFDCWSLSWHTTENNKCDQTRTVIQFLDYSAFWWNSTTRPSTKLKRHPRSGRQELLGLVQDSTSSCGRSCQLTVIFTDEAMIFRPRAQLLQCQLPGTLMRPCCAKKVPQMRDILVEPCKPANLIAQLHRSPFVVQVAVCRKPRFLRMRLPFFCSTVPGAIG